MNKFEAANSLLRSPLLGGIALLLASTVSMAQAQPSKRTLAPWQESHTIAALGTRIPIPPQILEEVKVNLDSCQFNSSPDEPLKLNAYRIRRKALVLVAVRGSGWCYCSATGNCAFWVYRLRNGNYEQILETDMVQRFGFMKSSTRGVPNLVLWHHNSAFSSPGELWKFDGSSYAFQCGWEWTTERQLANGDWDDDVEPYIANNTCGGPKEQSITPAKKN